MTSSILRTSTPYFLDYLGNKPFVLTIYDMVYELFPPNFLSQRQNRGVQKIIGPKGNEDNCHFGKYKT